MSDLKPSRSAPAPALPARLRALTPARVGLGRTGVSQQTRDVLNFQISHAQARDAVHARFAASALAAQLSETLSATPDVPVIRLHSSASDRATYLQRPDLGRKLDDASRAVLSERATSYCDLVLIVADGLSALACERHVQPLMNELLPRLVGWRIGPVCIVEQGRVAIGDEIGQALSAEISVILIGERPGLSSPDSLGAYITWQPRPGRTDADRNCISNIRAEGLNYHDAAGQLADCLAAARLRRLTGTPLSTKSRQLPKVEMDEQP